MKVINSETWEKLQERNCEKVNTDFELTSTELLGV